MGVVGGGRDHKGSASCCPALRSSVITLTSDSMARPRSSAMWNKLPIAQPGGRKGEHVNDRVQQWLLILDNVSTEQS